MPQNDAPKPELIIPSIAEREPPQHGPTGVGVSMDVETVSAKKIGHEFVYSATFVCGRIPHSPFDPQEPPLGFPLVPGTYRTAININNPNLAEVTFTKMALITNREDQPRGKAGDPVRLKLGIHEGIEIDCQDIESLLTSGSGVDLFNNENVDGVFSNPPASTDFLLSDPTVIKQLVTYHWNDGHGDLPGSISLSRRGGAVYGPFAARGVPGQNGVANANWVADLNQLVPAGSYTVTDSNPLTWSWNQQSASGFAIVRGALSFVGRAPFFKGFVVIRSEKELDVVAVYTVKNIISSVPYTAGRAGPSPNTPLDITLIATQSSLIVTVPFQRKDRVTLAWTVTGGLEPVDVRITVDGPRPVGSPLAGHLTWELKSRTGTSIFPNPTYDFAQITDLIHGGLYKFTATVTDSSSPPQTASTQATVTIL